MFSGAKDGSTMLSCASLPQRRCDTGSRDIYSPPNKLFNFNTEARRQCFDTDSLRSLSVSGASSLSGRFLFSVDSQ